jgi:hypothetical protein
MFASTVGRFQAAAMVQQRPPWRLLSLFKAPAQTPIQTTQQKRSHKKQGEWKATVCDCGSRLWLLKKMQLA